MGEEWYKLLSPLIKTDYFGKVGKAIQPMTFSTKKIFPTYEETFRAFRLTPPSKVKVVIVGLEPPCIHGVQADGLAFGSKNLLNVSPTMIKIFEEIERDVYDGYKLDQDPNLTRWADQGVFLLNAALTVEKKKPGSHLKMWDKFTRYALSKLSRDQAGVIYLLWGKYAKSFIPNIQLESNFILTADHPLEEGWAGNKHFTKANEILKEVAIGKDMSPDKYIIEW
jgi:uracil-DNA glycosylase